MIAQYYGTSMLSRAIKWRTYGPVSHTSWVTFSGEVLEAWHKGGVRENADLNENHTPGTIIDLYDVDGLTRDQRRGIEDFMRSQVGKGYAFHPVLRFISRRANKDRDIVLRLYPSELLNWFCSELVFTACRTQGVNLHNAPASRVHPTLLGYSTFLKPAGRWIVGETKSLSEARERVSDCIRPETGASPRKPKCNGLPCECNGVSIFSRLQTVSGDGSGRKLPDIDPLNPMKERYA